MSRKLIVSYTGLLAFLSADQIREEDLSDALLFFSCVREHALNPNADGEGCELDYLFESPEEAAKAQAVVVRAIEKAEPEGRIYWRTREEGIQSWENLNTFLQRHGYPAITYEPGHNYCYPYVEELIAAQNPELEVLWRTR